MTLKNIVVRIVCAGVLAALAAAQTTHSVVLTWADLSNPAGTTYSVYRATGLCSGTPTFSKLATAITVKTYTDGTVVAGNYCYQATATANGVESAPSNSVNPTVPTFPPTNLTFSVTVP